MPLLAVLLSIALVVPCPFSSPVDGPVVRDFAPVGSYGGHWGVDFSVGVGTAVLAAAAGRVSFAGPVAGRLSITIDHGGGVRTSYSYLSSVDVEAGQWVHIGEVIARTGLDHGIEALHYSLRVGNEYLRPVTGDCPLVPAPGLRLGGSPAFRPYPSGGATRHSRRNIRPTPHRPSDRRRSRLSGTGP